MRAAALLLLLGACAPLSGPGPAEPASPLYAGGDLLGYLEPCGCNRPQLGGLARRGTALGGTAFVENGNLVSGPGRLNEIRFETLLTALSALGCRALNVGRGELSLGLDFLRSARGLASFPFVSANVLDEAGEPAFPPAVDAGPWRIVGVLDPVAAAGRAVRPVLPAIREALAGTPEGFGVVVLYQGPVAGARRVIRTFPRVTRVVYAAPEARIESERLVTPGDRGRRLVRLDGSPRILSLTGVFPADPRMVESLAAYVSRVRTEDLLHRMNPEVEPEAGGYVGDDRCATCHAAAMAVHGRSRHAAAIRSLERTGREIDPGCVGCHVVGYGERTGFTAVGESPTLARVGCEACHGPGRRHSLSPASPTVRDARSSCVTCHSVDTDPQFSFEKRWSAIRHR